MKKNKNDINNLRVLVVGSWAKEQITIENIKKNKDIKIYSYMDTKNPAISSLVNDYKIGKLSDLDSILEYVKNKEINFVIITTAEPLSLGLVDKLKEENVFVFGPSKKASKLESDKSFSRELMKKYNIDALPDFKIFNNSTQAIKYAEDLDWKVAVKPIGLTEGLGVKVYGDQLKSNSDVKNYISEIFEKKIGGEKKLIIEEKLEGKEFTIQCFVYENKLISTPAVKDFKKLLAGDRGPNTASMGSYSDNNFILPFMKDEDYIKAIKIMVDTLKSFKKETNESCNGILYGQFMITKKGLKLIEYNFRPGDPEWMNIISIMEQNIIDIINNMQNDKTEPINFENKATVCKYIVPNKYPLKLNEKLIVNIDKKKINSLGVNIYYSCGIDKKDELKVGSERGIAFLSKADTIKDAYNKIEKAISFVEGEFHYREDIGKIK